MATVAYLDTHVAAWLYAGRLDLLPDGVRSMLLSHQLLVSPMVVLELQYLFEVQRVNTASATVLVALAQSLGVTVCGLSFERVVKVAADQGWTRDPFDRLIVSHALAGHAPLVTKDEHIRQNCRLAVWDTPR